MFLPQTFGAALFVLILGMLCLGLWSSVFKSAKLRYELSYLDFVLGVFVLAVVYSLTIGNLGFDGFSLTDDLAHSGKRQWFYGFLAGVIFNFGNMLIMSSVSVSGLSLAFPVSFGVAMVVSTVVQMIGGPSGEMALNVGGCLAMLAAVLIGAFAYNIVVVMRHEAKAKSGKAKTTRRPSAMKAVILAVVGGLLLGSYLPLIDRATEPEIGLGPFSLTLMFTAGMVFCTTILSIFFINLPVEGEPVELGSYLNVSVGTHLRAFLSGAIFCSGLLGVFVALNGVDLLKNIPLAVNALRNGAPLLAAILGLVVFREFRDGDARAKNMAVAMLVMFAAGVALFALATLHIPKTT